MNRPVRTGILLALLLAAALYVRMNPPERIELGGESLAELPTEFGEWRSVELRFEEVVYEELDADDTLARRYSGPDGRSIWFVIVFHQNERYGAHDPLVCYRSQGWSIEQSGVLRLGDGPDAFDANWIRAQAPGHDRAAIYWWYTAGDLATADRDEFMSRMATSGIRSNVTFGAFVRVSTTVSGGDVDEALDVVTTFAEQANPHIRSLFVGTTGGGG
ncbi:MAG: EpsI family protein [Candidatus Eisenbacteria bacterium]|nr:EpsI family protein [Candidatus Eisenbacteria bacterium]